MRKFLCEIWGVASFGTAKASNLRKFSPRKSYFNQFAKVFSLESFPLYGNSHGVSLVHRRVSRGAEINSTTLSQITVAIYIVATIRQTQVNVWPGVNGEALDKPSKRFYQL